MLQNGLHPWRLPGIGDNLSDLPGVFDQYRFIVLQRFHVQENRQNLREYAEMKTFLQPGIDSLNMFIQATRYLYNQLTCDLPS